MTKLLFASIALLVVTGAFAALAQVDPKSKEGKEIKWKAVKAISNDKSMQSSSLNNFAPTDVKSITLEQPGNKTTVVLNVEEVNCLRSKVTIDQLKDKPCKRKAGGIHCECTVEFVGEKSKVDNCKCTL